MNGNAEPPSTRSNASLTRLPPSPDLHAVTSSNLQSPEFSLSSSIPGALSTATVKRLQSIARYQAFFPQALACSNTLTSYVEQSSDTNTNASSSTLKHNDTGPSSLGAVAGSQGVALFRLSRPHVPLLILSHATNTSSRSSITSLSFEPKNLQDDKSNSGATSSLYLAATRGSGVLIWDASGHSPNPLMGRLGTDQSMSSSSGISSSVASDTRVTSICWKASNSAFPLLAATTASALCLWDLRASNAAFKPSTRFGMTRRATGPTPVSPLVQSACSSDSDECATIDTSGVVRIYDIRMTDKSGQGNPVSTYAAHETAGVGIAYFGLNKKGVSPDSSSTTSRWLTWGLDAPMSCVVKIWGKTDQQTARQVSPPISGPTSDEYWDMSEKLAATNGSAVQPHDYQLMAQCVRPKLACARVCLSPVEDKFMAVGHLTSAKSISTSMTPEPTGGWFAELYQLSDQKGEETLNLGDRLSNRSFGITKVAGFQGGNATNSEDRQTLVSVLGSQTNLGTLQAAELAFEDSTHTASLSSVDGKREEDKSANTELVLCCLSDTGVITTHVSYWTMTG